jgi:hypothetical protein
MANIADSTKACFLNEKATAQQGSRVAFVSFRADVEIDCTASTAGFKRVCGFYRRKY